MTRSDSRPRPPRAWTRRGPVACAVEPLEGRRLLSVALGLSGKTLFAFDTDRPDVTLARTSVTGVSGREKLIGIDFRPADGRLYAVSSKSRVYRVDPGSGRSTRVDAAAPVANAVLAGTYFGLDFDPVADKIRVVSDAGANARFDPDTGALVDTDPSAPGTQTDAPLAYAPGDPNAGRVPRVTALGYSRAAGGATTAFGVDTDTNALVTVGPAGGPPDAAAGGLLSTVGTLTVDTGSPAGFDVDPNGPADVGFAAFVGPAPNPKKPAKFAGPSTLYRVDLTTGAATAVGTIGATNKPVTDVAVVPRGDTVLAVDAKNRLYTFDSYLPSVVTARVAINGLVTGETVVGVDARPADGRVFAFTNQGRLYALDPVSGLATTVGQSAFAPAKKAGVGVDVDPVGGSIRVVDTAGDNVLLTPADTDVSGTDPVTTQPGSPLAYVAGDVAAGLVPAVSGIAYGNNVAAATATTLYALDGRRGTLATIGSAGGATPADTGQVFTVGPLRLKIKGLAGFDIASDATDPAAVTNRAYAAFKAGGGPLGLYAIDLSTGAATAVAALGKGVTPVAIAVLPV